MPCLLSLTLAAILLFFCAISMADVTGVVEPHRKQNGNCERRAGHMPPPTLYRNFILRRAECKQQLKILDTGFRNRLLAILTH
jgi:hypothetical protein